MRIRRALVAILLVLTAAPAASCAGANLRLRVWWTKKSDWKEITWTVPTSGTDVTIEVHGGEWTKEMVFDWHGEGVSLRAYQKIHDDLHCSITYGGSVVSQSSRTDAGSIRCRLPDKVRAQPREESPPL